MPLNPEDIQALYQWLDERMIQLSQDQSNAHSRLREDMNRGFQGVNSRLDTLNGKTNKHDSDIAVLRDRSERAERQTSIIGSVTGGGAAGIVLLIKAWLTK